MKNQSISVLLLRVVTRDDCLLPDCCFGTVSRESQKGHVNNQSISVLLPRIVTHDNCLLPDCCFETVPCEN